MLVIYTIHSSTSCRNLIQFAKQHDLAFTEIKLTHGNQVSTHQLDTWLRHSPTFNLSDIMASSRSELIKQLDHTYDLNSLSYQHLLKLIVHILKCFIFRWSLKMIPLNQSAFLKKKLTNYYPAKNANIFIRRF